MDGDYCSSSSEKVPGTFDFSGLSLSLHQPIPRLEIGAS